MKTREDRRFQIFGNIVMMAAALTAIIPMILLLVSSLTDNDTLIRNGYSFFPEKWSLSAYQYIFQGNNSAIHAYGISILLTAT